MLPTIGGMMSDHPSLVPLGYAARRLHVPARWLRNEALAGRIPHLRAGNRIVFDAELVERILIERARTGQGVNHAR